MQLYLLMQECTRSGLPGAIRSITFTNAHMLSFRDYNVLKYEYKYYIGLKKSGGII